MDRTYILFKDYLNPMKKLLFLLLFSGLTLMVHAQNSEIPKPEFSEQPYLWLKKTNELIKLSKEKADMKTSLSMKVTYSFAGMTSQTVVEKSDGLSFLIITTMPVSLNSATLYKLEVKKKKSRFVEVASAGIGGMDMKDENAISMDYKKVGDDLYELVISEELTEGEYAFTNGMNSFTFTIQ